MEGRRIGLDAGLNWRSEGVWNAGVTARAGGVRLNERTFPLAAGMTFQA